MPPHDTAPSRALHSRAERGWSWVIDHPRLWYVGFGLQALLMLVGVSRELRNFALTHDFAGYWQAVWWMGARHRWFPRDTVFGWPFFANAGEWVMIPIGFVGYALWPHPSLLLIIQTGSLVGAEFIAWQWMAEASRGWTASGRFLFLGIVMVSLASNPWVLHSDFTDFHSETILALATVGTAWALARNRWKAMIAGSLLALSCGTVGTLVVIGLAGSAVFRRQWLAAIGFAGAGFATLLLISGLHWDHGSLMAQSYQYLLGPHPAQPVTPWMVLQGFFHHPARALQALVGHRIHLAQNWVGSAFLGWGDLTVLGPILIITLINNLVQPGLVTQFGAPGFQSVMLYPLLSVGSLSLLMRWGRSGSRWGSRGMVAGLTFIVLATLGWFVLLWPSQWLPSSTAVGTRLAEIEQVLPSEEEVIASQEIVGRFANRPWVYSIMRGERFPLHTSTTAVLLSPGSWGHFIPPIDQQAEIVDLEHNPKAQLVSDHDGVWWFAVRQAGPSLALPYPVRNLAP